MPELRRDRPAAIGTAAQPASGAVYLDARFDNYPYFSLTFTLAAARVPVTDGAGSGSSGTLKIFDFNQGGISFLGCRQDFTAFAEGSALTTAQAMPCTCSASARPRRRRRATGR